MTDANEIIHALRLWFQAGDVFEVRVLDAVSADYRRASQSAPYSDRITFSAGRKRAMLPKQQFSVIERGPAAARFTRCWKRKPFMGAFSGRTGSFSPTVEAALKKRGLYCAALRSQAALLRAAGRATNKNLWMIGSRSIEG